MSDIYRFLLRLPEPLRRRLVEAADRSGRSLNAELVHRLERSLDPWAPRKRVATMTLRWLGGAAVSRRTLAPLGAVLAAVVVAVGGPDSSRHDGSGISLAAAPKFLPADGQGLSPRAAALAARARSR